jgi:fido (protein-threonine AMPylation protein)
VGSGREQPAVQPVASPDLHTETRETMQQIPATRQYAAATFDTGWVDQLHRDMYGEVWDWAGKHRLEELTLGCPYLQINDKLYNLLENLKYWNSTGMSLLEQSARLHHGLVEIHPFMNGNGRWGRMAANIWMAIHNGPYVAWPDDAIGSFSPIRDEYVASLKMGDNGDIGPFLAMQGKYLRENMAKS